MKRVSRDFRETKIKPVWNLSLNKSMPRSLRIKLSCRKKQRHAALRETESRRVCYFYIIFYNGAFLFSRSQHPSCASSVDGADPVFSRRSPMTDAQWHTCSFCRGPECPFMAIHAHIREVVTLNSGEYRRIARLWGNSILSEAQKSKYLVSLLLVTHC